MKTLTPLDLGALVTVEGCPKITIDHLLKQCRQDFKESMITSQLKIMGVNVELTASKTKFNGKRLWFKCPLCRKKIGVLFKHPISQLIGCRLCLHLRYQKQRYKGMTESSLQ